MAVKGIIELLIASLFSAVLSRPAFQKAVHIDSSIGSITTEPTTTARMTYLII